MGPHLGHDVGVGHVQVILIQFAEEGSRGRRGSQDPILQQHLWRICPLHSRLRGVGGCLGGGGRAKGDSLYLVTVGRKGFTGTLCWSSWGLFPQPWSAAEREPWASRPLCHTLAHLATGLSHRFLSGLAQGLPWASASSKCLAEVNTVILLRRYMSDPILQVGKQEWGSLMFGTCIEIQLNSPAPESLLAHQMETRTPPWPEVRTLANEM